MRVTIPRRGTVAAARDFALRFRMIVESTFFPAQGRSLKITASLGVSSYPETGISDAEDLTSDHDCRIWPSGISRIRVVKT